MKKILLLATAWLTLTMSVEAREYHVSVKGDDSNPGTESAPFRTIGKAADYACPGDVITVHAGTYREWVNPPRGGESNDRRIVYRAAPGERVELKGSEQITGWERDSEHRNLWKVTLPDTFFGDYNPYEDSIRGDWFYDHGRIHHTGEVFLDGRALYEKESLEKVLQAAEEQPDWVGTWYCSRSDGQTTIWADFRGADPNHALAEISVRRTCFYSSQPGINYITLSGFHISQAATQWAAPTAEQIGMVATHWNKGWIIENNVISDSKCVGITLGKERATGHNVWLEDPSIDGSLHYIEVTFRTIRAGWNKENIGSHIVRGNVISNCGQAGICGSMGAAFSVVENNHIYDIWTQRQYSGAEIGGIKLHAAIDTRIEHNRIHNTCRGIWLDWMTQGTRVSRNLLYGNDSEDLFFEVDHGPFLVDNNILGSPVNLREQSQGGAYVHNLFMGKIFHFTEATRYTPYFLPHSTEVAGLSIIPGGDDRFVNNIFAPQIPENADKIQGVYGLSPYDKTAYPMLVEGNVYYRGATLSAHDKNRVSAPEFDATATIEQTPKGEVYCSFSTVGLDTLQTRQVDTEMLGQAKLPRQAYEDPDGKPITISRDFLNVTRAAKPSPGPFESIPAAGQVRVRVW
ncbi:right-handed parallel beta-helix repeat-containing protein [Millionella massiliensis]|uniref:right-handed parallel beta-helix repeat-containing protein n=1 Tax=Millionella massiliensis TaxID=1871023 RepID=UPI0024B7BB76|nr:right-handed parallel beta-helix repeat-containing protein [Millionella massiliensis]